MYGCENDIEGGADEHYAYNLLRYYCVGEPGDDGRCRTG